MNLVSFCEGITEKRHILFIKAIKGGWGRKTSLLQKKLQTLPDAPPPIGNIQKNFKIA